MKLRLRITSGTLAGRVYDLETGFVTIGRSNTCSVQLDPQTERIASKQHAFIEARPDGFFLTDNKSTNGTLLNGQRIETWRLNSGDHIQFGTNGVTASIEIDLGLPPAIVSGEQSFRDYEVQQFNQTVAQEPAGVQSSLHNFGLNGAAVIKPEPTKTGAYIGIGLTIFAIIFMVLIVALLMFASVGIVPAVIATVVAFVPAMVYLLPLIWLDRYDPEPAWLLGLAFAWGALVAVIVSFVVNTVLGAVTYQVTQSADAATFVGAVISAPIFEEASKGLGLVVLLVFFRRYFDDVLDGIVFAGVIALGFATVENVLYYGRAVGDGGLGGLTILFLIRGIASPFAHVTFTVMIGIGCGISRESHNPFIRILMPIIGYIGAVALHAIWNGMAVIGGLQGFAIGYAVLQFPFFCIFVIFSLLIMWRQNRILKEMLAIDIARGLIPADLAAKATSAFRSSFWILSGFFDGKFKARNRFVQAVGKLGLSYWHIQRATAAKGQTGSFQQNPILREEVLKWKDKV